MPRRADRDRRVTPQPAMRELMALVAAMRPDWDPEQIIAELAGCPWSLRLAVEAVRATATDDDRLRVANAFVFTPSHRVSATAEQLAAYTDYIRRHLPSGRTGHTDD
ncbi:hypothetical protein ABT352_32840 [Streptosporangium sp. NPDC000563]|uniref:hypothetical protein n=1 Tax=Streptosporangium sp. NPDC000563 TaxID=3154366 RepID=UPI003325EEC1